MVRERARRSDDDDLGGSSRASLLPNYRSEEKKDHNEPEKRYVRKGGGKNCSATGLCKKRVPRM